MKIYIIFFLLMLIAASEASTICSRVNSGFFVNNIKEVPADSSINITYYKLHLNLQLNPNQILGVCQVNGKINNSGSSFFLNLSNSLLVDSVTGNNIANFSHQNDKLFINLQSGSNDFSVNIFYKGLPPQTGWGSFVFSNHSSNPVIWSLSEPFGSSDWFPNKNTPADKADSLEVWITCPASLTGVSNGRLYETTINTNNTKTFKWKSSYPIASYLISIAVSNYTLYKNYFKYSQSDSMEVTHFIYPEHFNQVKQNLDRTPQYLSVFSRLYTLYPFINEKYGHAEFNWGGGMEHQTISSMGTFSQDVIIHELAHQWYGDKITCRTFNHIWLNEGFATYSVSAMNEELNGKEAYKSSMQYEMSRAKNAKGSIYLQSTNNINEIFDGARSYSKGAVVLHMLRGVLGDSAFYKTMRDYAADTSLAFGTAVTEDFQRVAETVSGKNLSYFFNEWIYGENYPRYIINYTQSEKPNEFTVNLNITQSQNTFPAFFTMPCDLKFKTKNGDTTITVFNNSPNQNFIFTFPTRVERITFDPDDKILKEKKGDEPAESIDFRLFQNYPNPFNPGTYIPYMIKASSYVSIKVFDASGREVASLVNTKQKPGAYEIVYYPKSLASGVYLYQLQTDTYTESKKMLYIK